MLFYQTKDHNSLIFKSWQNFPADIYIILPVKLYPLKDRRNIVIGVLTFPFIHSLYCYSPTYIFLRDYSVLFLNILVPFCSLYLNSFKFHSFARSPSMKSAIFARVFSNGNTLSRPSIFLPLSTYLQALLYSLVLALLIFPLPRLWPFLSAWPFAVSEILHIQTWNTPEAECTILPLPVTRTFLLIIAIN